MNSHRNARLGFAGRVCLALGPALRRRRARRGATDDEVRHPLPGDDLVPRPDWSYTHPVTVAAPRTAVWPWLVQLGQGRGGFYSYEPLENLAGCDIHNVSEIRPDLQRLQEGDVVHIHGSVWTSRAGARGSSSVGATVSAAASPRGWASAPISSSRSASS